MSVYVVCTGTELLIGDATNTNLAYAGALINGAGIPLMREITVPDERAAMTAVIRQALAESTVVITVGGLGPTADDLTKSVVASVLGVPLEVQPALVELLKAKYTGRTKWKFPESAYMNQATVPRGATVLPNEYGTAPGLWCPYGSKAVVMLPGPPREFQPLLKNHVLPLLQALVPPSVRRQSLSVYGIPESLVEERTMKVIAPFPAVEPAYCIKPGRILVRLASDMSASVQLAQAVTAVQAEFGVDAGPADLDVVGTVVNLMRARGGQLAVAESCTGGALAKMITDLPGVSDVFLGGVVSYANELKMGLLGVPAATLAEHGAVSEATARAMVTGLVTRLGVQAGIAITGIAGPSGGTPDKPVGTVHIATCYNGEVRATQHLFPSTRTAIRDRCVVTALNQLRVQLLAG